MNKKYVIIIALFLLSTMLIFGTVLTKNNINNSKNNDKPYVLMVKEDHVALYKNGKEIKDFQSVNFYALPEFDQNKLKKGIEFNSIEMVYKAIEDYDG